MFIVLRFNRNRDLIPSTFCGLETLLPGEQLENAIVLVADEILQEGGGRWKTFAEYDDESEKDILAGENRIWKLNEQIAVFKWAKHSNYEFTQGVLDQSDLLDTEEYAQYLKLKEKYE